MNAEHGAAPMPLAVYVVLRVAFTLAVLAALLGASQWR